MAENDPAQPGPGSSPGHSKQSLAVVLLKLCWPLPGALTGAAVGFHVYFRQPGLNTDTVAPLFFAGFWAFCGLLIGTLCSSAVALLIEHGLSRWLPGKPLITASLSLLCLIGLCYVLRAPLEARLPVLIWPALEKLPARPQAVPTPSPCTQTPPTERKARQAWDLECR
ncbi:MAG: hypothetical protein IPJ48_02760 [Propionivibrio sp.]|uniref:Transmembrane protein n=1 Tax=Candidatus Propionivibrio dominans TaxID=2954373 RepID=A0A9D7F921_9RHOO|nr:hypothetical protein [Candidatus Propionivibrio dominans]MBL0166125.1 hypothetical protein [Propionivibrio sp.]